MELNMNTSIENIAFVESMNRMENERLYNLKSRLESEQTTPNAKCGMRCENPKNYPSTPV